MDDDQTPVELPSVRGQPPTKPKLTVCEVLTWIAFGEAIPKERLGESEREESDMDVRETRAAWNALEQARRLLRDAWQAGNLQVSGCNHRGEYVPSIAVEISEDLRNELTWWDTIESDPAVKSPFKRGPATPFTNVKFETAAVLSVWPMQPKADEGDGVRTVSEPETATPAHSEKATEVLSRTAGAEAAPAPPQDEPRGEDAQVGPSPTPNAAELPSPAISAGAGQDTTRFNGVSVRPTELPGHDGTSPHVTPTQPSPSPVQEAPPRKRGIKPIKRNNTTERMVKDYADRGADALNEEKQSSLQTAYGPIGVGTLLAARDAAVARLRSSDKP